MIHKHVLHLERANWLKNLTQRLRLAQLPAALAVATLTTSLQVRAQTLNNLAPLSALAPVQGVQDLYLEVMLNDEPTHLISQFRAQQGKLSTSVEELRDLGIAIDSSSMPDRAQIPLDSINGLHYSYDAAHQTISIQVPDGLRIPHAIALNAQPALLHATSGRGIVLNYDAYAQTLSGSPISIWNEARYFDPAGVFSNTGVARFHRNRQDYMRYDTSWTMSDPKTLNTYQFGDAISSSLSWSRSLHFGGFQWRKNFALNPNLITFPLPSLAGSAVVPSSVELYINSMKRFSQDVPSGPFILSDITGLNGGGNATLITRDALGRSISTTVPLYIDTRLLAAGLSSYSVEAGFLRRSYGLDSFDYNRHPAVSGSLRYGLSDKLTAEAHSEVMSGVYNVGAGVLAQLGRAGVVNASLSGSSGHRSGAQAGLGYQLILPRITLYAQTLRALSHYSDLASRIGTPQPRATDQISLTLPLTNAQHVSFSYIGLRYPNARASRVGSIGYTLMTHRTLMLQMNAFQDFNQHNSRGILLSAGFSLGGRTSVNTTVGKQNGKNTYTVGVSRTPDYDGGIGWGAQTTGMGSGRYSQGQAQYLGRAGQITVLAQDGGGQQNVSLDINGAIVLMDKSITLSRQIYDGFALVSTDGIKGVPVLHENRPIGVTDRSGHFLIPNLSAYQNNHIGIDPMRLPVDMNIAQTKLNLAPQDRSGVLAHFSITRPHAASLILRGPDGAPLPVGTQVRHLESGDTTIVGYDGLAFIAEGLQPTNHLEITNGEQHYSAEFSYMQPKDGTLSTITPVVQRTK